MATARDTNGHIWSVTSSHIYLERRIDDAIALLSSQSAAHAKLDDTRYASTREAAEAALKASEHATSIAFAAQQEAVNKSESAQRLYDSNHNDLLRKMEGMQGEFARDKDLQPIATTVATLQGRIYGAAAVAGVASTVIASLCAALITLWLHFAK